ncbi:MAG: hypothetical protein QS748_02955 [Candidatus Endonucleobacter bathymodioli]|uniref:Uncharacterized protein n=1 Tax=Candidatus Endonucleibacter bathymodioli TaxID=539814 RepID=A0AA90NRY2_9GAMM|nr:hypothetical protein [Candidatus Endonucleobacter bathymodioli]
MKDLFQILNHGLFNVNSHPLYDTHSRHISDDATHTNALNRLNNMRDQTQYTLHIPYVNGDRSYSIYLNPALSYTVSLLLY